jgi:sporulation protein YlmC with PRC-barrel domain
LDVKEKDMDLPIDAEVVCMDGPAGRSKSIIIDPIHQKVTHIVVAEKRFPHSERLVPLGLLASTEASRIHLRCTLSELASMEPFIELEYVTEEGIYPEGEYRDRFYWPHVLPEEDVALPIEIERIPLGELVARRGMHVQAKDGSVGRLDEYLVNPADGHITHLVIREGPPWAQSDVTVPVSGIDRITEDTVFLKLDHNSLKQLPMIPVRRRDPRQME